MKKLKSVIICAVLSLLLFSSCASKNTYKVAIDSDFSPFCSVDSSGKAVGFEIDILNTIAKDCDINVEYVFAGYPEAVEILEKGDADVVLAAVIPTNELGEKLDFTNTYYNNEYAAAVRKGKNSDFIKLFNDGLEKLYESGEYDRIYSNYFMD